MQYSEEIIKQAQTLREQGRTFAEIQSVLGITIPKGTLSYWCKDIKLSKDQKQRISALVSENIQTQRLKALAVNRERRATYLDSIKSVNTYLPDLLLNTDIAKITLAALYLAEGSKTTKGALAFGNSDPGIIKLFLNLLRLVYNTDPKKYRCTVQCRADQNIPKLEQFWKEVTRIPEEQFYKAKVDPRTIGKPSKKPEYKGVCRIDYFDANVYNELRIIGKLLTS
jgi:hypothetical protein